MNQKSNFPTALVSHVILSLMVLSITLEAEDFSYVTNKGAITITGYTGGGDAVIPSAINGLPVTSIGDWAFYNCFTLTGVTIPETVTNIGWAAYRDCTSLTRVVITNNLISIGDWAFASCTRLTSVTIPNTVTNIGLEAFAFCTSLTTITVDARNAAYASVDGVLFNKAPKHSKSLVAEQIVYEHACDLSEMWCLNPSRNG